MVKVLADLGMKNRVRLMGLRCGFDWCYDISDFGAGVEPGCTDPVWPAPAAFTEESIQLLESL
ncbi:hypothetical protein CU663_28840 [Pseudomonas syringae pv. actinidifoliorum]|nr:hypothetical protein [Pseudomonas syringae pv. actinidifoliorum]